MAPCNHGNDRDVYLVLAWSRVHMATIDNGNDRDVYLVLSLVKSPYGSM